MHKMYKSIIELHNSYYLIGTSRSLPVELHSIDLPSEIKLDFE